MFFLDDVDFMVGLLASYLQFWKIRHIVLDDF